MAKKSNITPKQMKALMVLSVGRSQAEAATAAGVSAKTVAVWMKDEDFLDERRLMMERMRHQFESRVMQVANNAMVVVQDMLSDSSKDIRAKGATLALNAAVRLTTRYKELREEGFIAPSNPMIILPADTKMPWQQKALAAAPPPPEEIVEVEAIEVAKE